MSLFFRIVLYSFIIVFVLSFILVYSNTHPPRYPIHIPPSDFGLAFENVEFITPDKIKLKGWFIKGTTTLGGYKLPVIIICHGLGANKSDFTGLASVIAGAGYHVLLFDFRGHGDSKGRASSIGLLEQRDLESAVKYVKARSDVDANKIGVYGFSLGAAVTILTASRNMDIKGVVSDSSFTSLRVQGERLLKSSFLPKIPFLYTATLIYEIIFRTDIKNVAPVNFIGKLSPTPIFIIGGEGDVQMPASDAKELFEMAGEPKFLWIIKGAFHGGGVSSSGGEYEKRIIAFFDKYLKVY
jgi:alpha-beta hydrolase superfamily lysophospholipase